MPPLTLPRLYIAIMIGNTIGTTPVGSPRKRFTTHVLPVGVFLMEVAIVYGHRRDFLLHPVHTGEHLSAYHLLLQLGILLRVIATAEMAISSMSIAAAAIGLLLLTAALTRTT